jgi:hypothetical protein
MDESFVQMREFMIMTESLIGAQHDHTPVVLEETNVITPPSPILEDLQNVVYKLRAFMESSDGDLGLGIELGMQRAAEMIENVIARHVQTGQGD